MYSVWGRSGTEPTLATHSTIQRIEGQEATMTEAVKFEQDGSVVTLTFNRPDTRNAITEDIVADLLACCDRVNYDLSVRCVILTGAGKGFSSGGNVNEMRERTSLFGGSAAQIRSGYREGIQRIPLTMYRLEVPVIAAVNGAAIGAGLDLAMMCDMRIASTYASFAEVFVKLGIIPGDGGAWFLPPRDRYGAGIGNGVHGGSPGRGDRSRVGPGFARGRTGEAYGRSARAGGSRPGQPAGGTEDDQTPHPGGTARGSRDIAGAVFRYAGDRPSHAGTTTKPSMRCSRSAIPSSRASGSTTERKQIQGLVWPFRDVPAY